VKRCSSHIETAVFTAVIASVHSVAVYTATLVRFGVFLRR